MSSTPPIAAAKPRTAADLVAQLDEAGIRRAVVLSTAYIFEQPSRKADAAAEKLRRENDWTSQQVARFPDRLIGFCGLNPLKDYALESWRGAPGIPISAEASSSISATRSSTTTIRAHRTGSRVLRAANDYRMTLVVHVRASVT